MRGPLLAAAAALVLVRGAGATPGAGFPRIANLWGASPLARDYARWARYDLLVMGGGPIEDWRRFGAEVRKRNPGIRLLGTAPLMNLGKPEDTPWMRPEWFACRPDGSMVRWWADMVYLPNLLRDDCLNALVGESDRQYGRLLRESLVDGLFYDSVVGSATWLGDIDLDGDGGADSPEKVNPAWHARQCRFFDRLRERWPGAVILANDVDLGHARHVNGRLFEGGPLLDRLISGNLHPREAIRTLDGWMAASLQPGVTFALMSHPLGWQGWRVGKGDRVTTRGEVDRVRRDYHRMRLGLLTTLMTDAYFAYDVGTVWYGVPLWYAEYEAPLGKPLGPCREVFGVPPRVLLDWRAGSPTRGLVLGGAARIAPAGVEAGAGDQAGGWQRLLATDPARVRFEGGDTYRIEADARILRKPSGLLQFNLRTATGGWERHDKGVRTSTGDAGTNWHIDVTVTPDAFDDYAAELHLNGDGAVRLTRLRVTHVRRAYLLREFEGGAAVLNVMPRTITVKLPSGLRRLRDAAAPRHVVEVDDESPGFIAAGAWERVGGEVRGVGSGYRRARKPGAVARWRFRAPAADAYTLFVSLPDGRGLTEGATYTVTAPAGGSGRALTQRGGDGGWKRLTRVRLLAGERCEVTLRSGGAGDTAADALRAESDARYNDGSAAQTIALAPLDGAVLVRRAGARRAVR
ncbi:MAG: hypothetical protein IT208_19665 [Chthonomonadales bacterium]|nr:hypothetical protein [Chthonomonadales bacterium]